MKLLVLGGTWFVGRAIVDEALSRGHDVTVVTRGDSGEPAPGVTWVRGDRTDPELLATLAESSWDAVLDTWGGPATVVEQSVSALAEAASWYGYVSSRSVYAWPPEPGLDETAPLVEVTPDGGYPADKRGAEALAVERSFAGRHLLARAGLILGPHEDTGRLTWWLTRAALGGALVAPGPPDRGWQYIDARDLAQFVLSAASAGTVGAFNLVCPRSDDVTTARLLEACRSVTGGRADLVWVDPDLLAQLGIREWEDLPGWLAPDSEAAGMHDGDVSAAVAAGLVCRPIEQTVADTWTWLQTIRPNRRPPRRAGIPRRGLSAEQEQQIWWKLGRR